MKPDPQQCKYCGKEIEGRKGKEFCSEAHSKAYRRNPDKAAAKPDIIPDKANPDTIIPDKLTATDQTFYDRALRDFPPELQPYYKFGEAVREETCHRCEKKFKTSLSLLKFCSYEHYRDSFTARVK